MSRPLTINLHDNDNEIHQITIQLYDPVYILENYLQGKEKRLLIFNGQLLMNSFSFAYYNIESGAHIYAVQSKNKHSHIGNSYFEHNMKKKLIKDGLELSNDIPDYARIRRNRLSTFVYEVSRLHDLQNMRNDQMLESCKHGLNTASIQEDNDNNIKQKSQIIRKKITDIKCSNDRKPYFPTGQ